MRDGKHFRIKFTDCCSHDGKGVSMSNTNYTYAVASIRVMEKVGMEFEGISRDSMFVKGRYVSIGTCAILRNDYIRIYGP